MLLLVGFGAAQGPSNSRENRKPALTQVVVGSARPYQVGTASWYGSYFHGKETASGEPYNMFDMTAAHPTLPLGTYVRVTNLHNRRAVIVRINDRGPVVPGRIIDLSYNAARSLDFKGKGLQRVRLDVIHTQTMAVLHRPALYRQASYQR